LQWENLGSGKTAGGEIAATWQAADNLSITGSYSYVNVDVPAAAFQDFNSAQPRHSVVLRSSLELTEELQLNAASYYVSEYLDRDETGDHVRLDLGLTWQVNPRLSVSIWGQNLLDSSTFEQDDEFLKSHDQEVPRAFYIRATVNW
jgi:outer membrane receptor protein involved in Fe transport